MMKRDEMYQIALILLGIVVTIFFAMFIFREAFPEYKIYQERYVDLEEFRSTYTGEKPPDFQIRVKQLVFEDPKQGQPTIDRCITCHVALEFPHFSPTKIALDVNGKKMLDSNGFPLKVPNENYVWGKLDEKIKHLEKDGNKQEAERLKNWKTVKVDENTFNITKVLQMHPLLGSETRPFEFHPLNNYGCTACHNGNGFSITTIKAHGPVFDGQYEKEFTGKMPVFLEPDPKNDPPFAHAYNGKPGDQILFQSNPLFIGHLIEAKCVQCHLRSSGSLMESATRTELLANRVLKHSKTIKESLNDELKAIKSLISLKKQIENQGYDKTLENLRKKSENFSTTEEEHNQALAQLHYFSSIKKDKILEKINSDLLHLLGNEEIITKLENDEISLNQITEHVKSGQLFNSKQELDQTNTSNIYVKTLENSWLNSAENKKNQKAFSTEIDLLTKDYQWGKELYINQACYACHRINGFSRGGVGPDLTNEGNSYLWFVKRKIVWPQGDLPTSTMPNYRLSHADLEDLMTFLMAQKGDPKSISPIEYQVNVKSWEEGRKMPWEEPINPTEVNNLKYGMTVFAVEGCASCHRLKGFVSNTGFTIEKEKADFDAVYKEKQWFEKLFPEGIIGSQIVNTLEKNAKEIDQRISNDVRQNSILEEIEQNHPGVIESFYENFIYARNAKNHDDNQTEWKERVHRVLLMYIQEYGLGRLIGPRPNWSGVFRSNEWLIEHFEKPSRHTARSLMPVMPFDITKFYALTYMLDKLAIKNRDEVKEIWKHQGFNPALAYQKLCSQCHGEFMHGDGPVSQWIYPIPKNLRNADFLTNYTRENVTYSITHGVKGTPMPPWGEVAHDKETDEIPVLSKSEIRQLVDWIYSGILTGTNITSPKDVPKWSYGPEDIIKEMQREKLILKKDEKPIKFDLKEMKQKSPETSQLNIPFKNLIALNDTSDIKNSDINQYFEVKKNPEPGIEANLYYIKKDYYTKQNIEAGQRFFELNCAVCHGIEADGMGYRAGTMFDAKPRMLTNLNWIETRDDLRLLRSIKYGVPGTAMTPWGDLTTSRQRMQLVIFIRTLSEEQEKRDKLYDDLYTVYDVGDQNLVKARSSEYQAIDKLKTSIDQKDADRQLLMQESINSDKVVTLFQDEIALKKKLKEHEEVDEILIQMQNDLKKEKDLYLKLGVTMLNKTILLDLFYNYLNLILQNRNRFTYQEDKLKFDFHNQKDLEESLIRKIEELIKQQSQKNDKEAEDNLKTLKTLKNDMQTSFAEAKVSTEKQKQLYNQYIQKLNVLEKSQ